jgi:hypothetical protein
MQASHATIRLSVTRATVVAQKLPLKLPPNLLDRAVERSKGVVNGKDTPVPQLPAATLKKPFQKLRRRV